MTKQLAIIFFCLLLLTACGGAEPTPTPAPAPPTLTPRPILPTATPTNTPLPTSTPTPMVSPLQSVLPTPSPVAEIPVYGYEIVEEYPHDPNAFTQGLILVDGVLYEGTGRRGQSTLRRVDLESGEVLQGVRLPDEFFGEGITLFNNRIYQLTWTSNTGFIFDPETFELIRTFTYPTEGWGLTHNGEQLIMSDGTENLYFLDPETLERTNQVTVTANGEPVTMLNELEYIDGLVYANIWQTDRIAKIDPSTGEVTAWIDMTGLFPAENRTDSQAVLNGIAYDVDTDRLYVTGKLWPSLFWVELIPPTSTE